MVQDTRKTFFRRLLALDDTPERIALAFAIGVFFGFSPLLGLHTILGLTVAFLFRLNRLAVLIGVYVNNPWTLVPYYAVAAYLGAQLMGFLSTPPLPDFGWRQLWSGGYWIQLVREWRIMMPLILGSTILSFVCGGLSYPLALYFIRQGRALRSR